MLRALTLFTLLLLAACRVMPPAGSGAPEFQLLPPAEGPAPVLLKQKIELQAGERQAQFLVVARYDRERLRLAILLPAGQRLLTLDYDGEILLQENFAAFDLPGREMLAIMQFARWPESSLRRHYRASAGWQVIVNAPERRLLTDSVDALTITYRPAELQIDNHIKEYRVIVQTLERSEI